MLYSKEFILEDLNDIRDIAERILNAVEGLSAIQSLNLAMAQEERDRLLFFELLNEYGYDVEQVITSHCQDDGDPNGHLIITKDNKIAGIIEFTCCGLSI